MGITAKSKTSDSVLVLLNMISPPLCHDFHFCPSLPVIRFSRMIPKSKSSSPLFPHTVFSLAQIRVIAKIHSPLRINYSRAP